MSAEFNVVTGLSMAVVSLVRRRFAAAFGARHTLDHHHLAEPLLERLRRGPTPACARRDRAIDVTGSRDLRALAYRHVVIYADARSQHNEILKRRTAGNSHLRHQNTVPADAHVMADLNQVVDLAALADHGVANGPAVNRGAGADFDVVLDDDAPDLRHLEVAGAAHDVAEAILTDLAAGVDNDPVADQRVRDHRPAADGAIAPDPHLGTDHRGRPDDAAAADFGARSNHRTGLDRDAAFQPRARMHMGARHIARRGK